MVSKSRLLQRKEKEPNNLNNVSSCAVICQDTKVELKYVSSDFSLINLATHTLFTVNRTLPQPMETGCSINNYKKCIHLFRVSSLHARSEMTFATIFNSLIQTNA